MALWTPEEVWEEICVRIVFLAYNESDDDHSSDPHAEWRNVRARTASAETGAEVDGRQNTTHTVKP